MLIEHFHNATCIVTSGGGTRVLCDPWFHDGVFEGSWCLAHEVPRIPSWRNDFDLIYISHVHPDHCDDLFLATLDRAVPIVVPTETVFPILVPKLRGLGFENVVALADRASATFDDLTITLFEPFQLNPFDAAAAFPNFLDSGALIRDGHHSFLNTNDNLPTVDSLRQIEEEFGIPDVTTLLYNSAGFYPQCIRDLDHDEKLIERQVVLDKAFDRCLQLAHASRSRHVMPFAGDYALGGPLSELNQYLPVSTPHVAAEFLNRHARPALALGAGGIFSIGDDDFVHEGTAYTEEGAFARAVSLDITYPYHEAPQVVPAELDAMIGTAYKRLRDKQTRLNVFPDYQVVFADPDGEHMATIDVSSGSPAHELTCYLDPRLLAGILSRRYHWDNAQIGCHISFQRSNHPEYSSDLHYVLALLQI